MTLWASLLLCLSRYACAHAGDDGRQPQFTASPVPVRAVNVGWRASPTLALGIRSWANGKRTRALHSFLEAVHRAPADPIAWHDLGVALYSASRFEEAHRSFTWERLLTPTAASAWYGLGMCEAALHRLPEATNAFIVAVNKAPREWEAWHRLGEVLAAQGQTVAAAYAADRAARLKPRENRMARAHGRLVVSIMGVKIPRIPSTSPR